MEELVLTLLVPPTPFTNKSVDQVSFAIETLLVSPSSDEESDAKHSIACLLACQNHEIAMKIFETKKDQLDSLVNQLKKEEDRTAGAAVLSPERMTIVASFWLNASSDKKVCARLQAEGLPYTLYQFIREENPKDQGRILKDIEEGLLKTLIELMLKVSAGHA